MLEEKRKMTANYSENYMALSQAYATKRVVTASSQTILVTLPRVPSNAIPPLLLVLDCLIFLAFFGDFLGVELFQQIQIIENYDRNLDLFLALG